MVVCRVLDNITEEYAYFCPTENMDEMKASGQFLILRSSYESL